MHRFGLEMSVAGAILLAFAAQGCDGGDGSSGSAASSGSAQGGAGGGTGGSAGEGGSGGSGGTGGSAVGGPFTSEGPSNYESQTHLAADSKGGLVAVWVAFETDGSSAIGYAVSRDAGAHWTEPTKIASPDGRMASNPTVVTDSQGRTTLVWLGFGLDFNNPDEHIYVSRLDSQTETFVPPVIASDDGTKTTLDFDKPSVTVDANDNLLVTWADFTGSSMGLPASLTFARSVDGQTFTRSTVTSDATFGNLASLCLDRALGPTAPLYMVHLGANGSVSLRTSTNQGQTWKLYSTPATSTLFQDITCVASGQSLWIAYAAGTGPFMFGYDTPVEQVAVIRSKDGGATFDSPVTASKPPAGQVMLYPRIARSASGKLGIAYYQGPVDGPAGLVLASSTDGNTWSQSPIVNTGTLTTDRTIASWLGGYIGFAIAGEKGYVTYADNSANKTHVKFAEIALP